MKLARTVGRVCGVGLASSLGVVLSAGVASAAEPSGQPMGVGNFGTCMVWQIEAGLTPSEFAAGNDPLVYIQRSPEDIDYHHPPTGGVGCLVTAF